MRVHAQVLENGHDHTAHPSLVTSGTCSSLILPTMQLRFFRLFIISVIAFDDSYEPFPEPYPTCADCLPASVHDAPGIGFSLSISSG
jgi:hypothetical protein